MDYLRGGSRKAGHGILETDVREFVMAGGLGAFVGVGAGWAINDYRNTQGYAAPLIVLGATGLGHMIGHELGRQGIESRKK